MSVRMKQMQNIRYSEAVQCPNRVKLLSNAPDAALCMPWNLTSRLKGGSFVAVNVGLSLCTERL